MTDDPKNPNDFDAEGYDDLEFDDLELEDSGYEDTYDETSAFEEADYDTDFDSGDEAWDEGDETEQAPAKKGLFGRKNDDGMRSVGPRKNPLSFNTMVIMGAVLVGGAVLVTTVMNSSADLASNAKSTFRSMIDIDAVMDGGIFGDKPAKSPQPAADQTAATEGFLNNPNEIGALSGDDNGMAADGTPPMPSPIAPAEEDTMQADPLTPLPRGPEDYADEDVPAMLPDASENIADAAPAKSAEDVLKEVMANRAAKQAAEQVEAISPVEEITDTAPIIPVPATEEETAEASDAPAPVSPAVADIEEANAKRAEAERSAQNAATQVKKLESEVASLNTTVTKLQSDLKAAQKVPPPAVVVPDTSAKDSAYEQKIAALEKQVAQLKTESAKAAREAETAREAAKKAQETAVAPKPVAAAPKPAPRPPAAQAPKSLAAATSKPAETGRWELRAAQPGKAWVSRPNSRDMQGITVGQTLPGIGRVTAITYLNGRWTVQGTEGQILQ